MSATLITPSMERLAHSMKTHARNGMWNGRGDTVRFPYFQNARRQHRESGTTLLFTRESGYHSSGWWRNPDYERCYHLSLSFFDPLLGRERPFDQPLAEAWVRCFFGDWMRHIWEEGPTGEVPIELRHYRVFCDPHWQPITPRGEVYSSELTEMGWKSFSDARAAEEAIRRQIEEREGNS
jgi:hypothetical protein